MPSLSIRFAALLLFASPVSAADVSVRLDTGSGFAVRNNTGAVERLRVDEATGNVSRNGLLFVHTSGFFGNVFVGPYAGSSFNAGTNNVAFGFAPLFANTSGYDNTAVGSFALRYNTTGIGNSALGRLALTYNTSGNRNSAFGRYALQNNTIGSANAAFGYSAMRSNQGGGYNAAFGPHALRSNTTGNTNAAFGDRALRSNTVGGSNSAFGADALLYSNTGLRNSAFGASALLFNTSGAGNTAIGEQALWNATTASYNIALGSGAGANQSTGGNNIYIANTGVGGESGQIKVGTVGTHTQAHVAGIHGRTSAGGIAVLVNASGTLGTTTSSARFKQDVRDMGDASDLLMRLRPVTFRYTEDAVGVDESKTTQYGLIAEEVATVAPELVAPDADGRPYSVKYHELPALLLNELQEQERTIAEQRAVIETLSARVATLEAR